MNPKRNRNRYRSHQLEEDIAKREVVKFVELNTKKNITIREHYLYLDDVKTAININTLEERHQSKLKFLEILRKGDSINTIINEMEKSAELDRHRLIKHI